MKVSAARKEEAIVLLAHGTNITETAKRIGVTRRTVTRWMSDDARFRERLEKLRAEGLEQMKSLLAQAGPAAVSVLSQVMMNDEDVAAGPIKVGDRMKAADSLLANLLKFAVPGEVLTYADKVGRELDKALKLVSPQTAQRIREAVADGLYRAGVAEAGVAPIVSRAGRDGRLTGDDGDNADSDSTAD